jgi:hypothetical protein
MKDSLIALTSIALAAFRLAGIKNQSYQAVAHLFLGGLFVTWISSKRWYYGAWFLGLCAVEVYQASVDHDLIGKLIESLTAIK